MFLFILFYVRLCAAEKSVFEQVFYAANAAHEVCGLVGKIHRLGLVALCHILQHGDVFLGEQIVGRVGALAHSVGDFGYGNGFGLGFAYARLCLTFGFKDLSLLLCFGAVDSRLLLTL